jgi:hypothetical protein
MKKIVSFGDSFVFGNELPNNRDGSRAWPALAAHDLGCAYETMAVAGCGNENIARQIYTYFSRSPVENTLAVINWTWCMRWDFFLHEINSWITLGPTCVPGKLQDLIGLDKAADLIDFYRTNLEPSHSWNVFRNLQCIYAVQSWLKQRGIKNVQTYMDVSMLEDLPWDRVEHYESYKDQSWPNIATEQDLLILPAHILDEVNLDFYMQSESAEYIKDLRTAIRPDLETFQGQTFLEWSYSKNFSVTDLLHPLEQAHRSAADLWCDRYAQLLHS